MSDLTRRAFLKLTAGTGAAMAVGPGGKMFRHLVPYVIPPENAPPGVWDLYATTCRECPAGCGMLVRHIDGRAVKCEGNSRAPIGSGGLCPRGQSAVQGHYDPDRLMGAQRRAGGALRPASWPVALAELGPHLAAARRVKLMSGLESGALAEVAERFSAAFGGPPPLYYEPLACEALRAAHGEVFGRPAIPDYRLDECDLVVSFGVDFLETWVSPVELAARLAARRARLGERPARFVYIGPRLSMTAANADEFWPVPPGGELEVALAMLAEVVRAGGPGGPAGALEPALAAFGAGTRLPPGIDAGRVAALAQAFTAAPGSAALAGPAAAARGTRAERTAVAAAWLNAAAGRIGRTVDFSRPHALERCAARAETLEYLADLGPEDVLLVHQANPVYSLPESAEAIARAGTVVYLGLLADETAGLASWLLPIDSPLETWGDSEARAGIHGLNQPATARLHQSRPAGDVLLALAQAAGRPLAPEAGAAPPDGFGGWLRARWQALGQRLAPEKTSGRFWRDALQAGGAVEAAPEGSAAAPPVRPEAAAVTGWEVEPVLEGPGAGAAHLWLYPSIMLYDGRLANRGWLQEAPDPMATIVWGSWIDLHPRQASALGLEVGDLARLTATGGRQIEAPVRITEDVAAGTAALALGQGHAALGRLAAGRGANGFLLLSDRPDGRDGRLPYGAVRLEAAGGRGELITTAAGDSQHGRRIVDWVALSTVRRLAPGQGEPIRLPLGEGYDRRRDLYPPRDYRVYRWAMAIDLDRCIGCGACAVACQAENNVPVAGPERLRKGRELNWLQVIPYRHPEEARRVGWLPLPCQHCDAAPCEPVCPVFAAVHNEEGLNAQIYNRCIGTRYCANNCPYKVRRFNWFDPRWEWPLDLQLNPEVTVRCRGVMEKCTFCIQRIREVEHRAKREGRLVRDGEIEPACVQSCPTRAYLFGNLLDPEAAVTCATRLDPRRYHLLGELNTKPAVTYLKRVRRDETV